jgi:hypothetical protein
MSEHETKGAPDGARVLAKLAFSEIEFPSDSLSVKHLRAMFPNMFDEGSSLTGGVSTFFTPDEAQAHHLYKLNSLVNYERTVADFGFFAQMDSVDERCKQEVAEAKKALEELYQDYRLAEGVETARLLIENIEKQGRKQAATIGSRER